MNITEKKRILTVGLCLLFCLAGILIGNSVTTAGEVSLVPSAVPTEASLLSNIIAELYPSFKTQLIQFAVIFVFSFTPYKYIANFVVFLARGFAIGYVVNLIDPVVAADMSAICFCISYFLITAVMLVCVSHLFRINNEKVEGYAGRFRRTANALLLFLMTTGASALIRALPLLIVYSTK